MIKEHVGVMENHLSLSNKHGNWSNILGKCTPLWVSLASEVDIRLISVTG